MTTYRIGTLIIQADLTFLAWARTKYLRICANADKNEDDNVTSEMISPHYVRILLKYYT